MSDFLKIIISSIENSVFCVDKTAGEGFVNKEDCSCFKIGEACCQSYYDKNKFHKYFKELIGEKYKELNYGEYIEAVNLIRDDVLKIANEELKNSKWFVDNVK